MRLQIVFFSLALFLLYAACDDDPTPQPDAGDSDTNEFDGDVNSDGDADADSDSDSDSDTDADTDGDSDTDSDSDGDTDTIIDDDWDDDGLPNHDEDFNGNGIIDYDKNETDPWDPDTDNDGHSDSGEFERDSDGDGIHDTLESSRFDEDGDGIMDESDSDHTNGPCRSRISGGRREETLELTRDCSPYLVDGHVLIPDTTLSIESGVTVRFRRRSSIQLGEDDDISSIYAEGTPENPIYFMSDDESPQKGDWGGIVARNVGFIEMDYVSITEAGEEIITEEFPDYEIQGGLVVFQLSSRLIIRNSNFTNNAEYGFYIDLEAFNDSVAFELNDLRNNDISLGIGLNILPDIDLTTTSFGPGRIQLLRDTLSNSVTLHDLGAPYYTYGDLNVLPEEGAKEPTILTIYPGVEMRFPTDAQIVVGSPTRVASLSIMGASDNQVVMGPQPTAEGAWGGIETFSGTNVIQDTFFVGIGAQEGIEGHQSATIARGVSTISFGGSEVTFDSVGHIVFQESTDCSLIGGLPSIVRVLGSVGCAVYCYNPSTEEGGCR